MLTEADRRALLLYPELYPADRLVRRYRWTFTLEFDDGEPALVAGGRLWPYLR